MIHTYKYSNKPLTIITELIAILLIFNKLKFNLLLIIISFNWKDNFKRLLYYL